MKIVLLVVGKTVESYFIQGIEEYSKRLAHYVPFEIAVIPELRNTKSLSTDQQKEREADFILKSFLPGDYIVLLDEHGKEFTSTQFASYLEKKMSNVAKRLIFVIGAQTMIVSSRCHAETEQILMLIDRLDDRTQEQ